MLLRCIETPISRRVSCGLILWQAWWHVLRSLLPPCLVHQAQRRHCELVPDVLLVCRQACFNIWGWCFYCTPLKSGGNLPSRMKPYTIRYFLKHTCTDKDSDTRCVICSCSYINYCSVRFSCFTPSPMQTLTHAGCSHLQTKRKCWSFLPDFHLPTIAINTLLASFSPHTALISTLISSVLLCLQFSVAFFPCYYIYSSSALSRYVVLVYTHFNTVSR